MELDKKEHKNLLLQLINMANFKGDILETAVELKIAIQRAKIKENPEEQNEPNRD